MSESKADYVRRRPQTRDHLCHWPGCGKQCLPAMWGCNYHWYMLPEHFRRRIWASYRPGQEVDGRPSGEYLAVALEVREWILSRHPPK